MTELGFNALTIQSCKTYKQCTRPEKFSQILQIFTEYNSASLWLNAGVSKLI